MLSSTLFEGRRVRLVPLVPADAQYLARWQMDADYLRLLDAQDPAYPKTEQQLVDWIHDRRRGNTTYLFGIRLQAGDELIGFIELGDILWPHRTSWLAVGIGDRAQRGQGYGYEALALALDFAFLELNLYRVQLTVFEYNEPAIKLYEKLGFRREGAFREFMQRDGRRWDMHLYGILAHEWAERSR
ncbi:MAG: GNAT family N-acetyltransferase [Chloroflexi bacterium]|nr:GNAT family N-acetyltransferase [Chloroflexota bacterium]